MLVSHRYQFIYTKTAKTAGTSVESYFEQYCMPEGEWTPEHGRDLYSSETGIIGFRGSNRPKDVMWFHHMSAKKIRDQIGEDIWNRYYKFCVIRDPFDKTVSAFFHFKKFRESGAAGEPKANKSFKEKVLGLFKPKPKFRSIRDEFEHWLVNDGMSVDRDKYVIDGEFCMDDVIRYEILQDDMRRVCERLGVEFEAERLPTFKKGIRDDKIGLSEIYTPKSIEIVSGLFDYELERFGYQAPKLA